MQHSLHPDDSGFLARLMAATGLDEARCLALLMPEPGELEQGVQTRIEGGRFTGLSLRRLMTQIAGVRRVGFGALGALRELDCSGLGIEEIGVTNCHALEVLVCADNALRQLELPPGLRELDCCGNAIMVLDLRVCAGLEWLDCSGNSVSALVLANQAPLRVLRAGRNELMALDLGDQLLLEVLVTYRNPLHQLSLGDTPRLRLLDCARNELRTLSLARCPALTELRCDRNSLDALDVSACPELEVLVCSRNYLFELRLSAPRLKHLACSQNQLEALDLRGLAALQLLDAGENRLSSMHVAGCRSLKLLSAAGNELRQVDLSECGALCALDLSHNLLDAIDLSGAPGLARLALQDNPLDDLDIRDNQELAEIQLNHIEGVHASSAQRHRLAPLRAQHRLGTGATEVAGMDAWELHDYARAYRWTEGERGLIEVVQHPACDLGTAVMIYWMGSPHFYLRYSCREQVPPYQQEGWDLLQAIEARVGAAGFASAQVPFDPRNDKQTHSPTGHDWTADTSTDAEPALRSIPDALFLAVPLATGAR